MYVGYLGLFAHVYRLVHTHNPPSIHTHTPNHTQGWLEGKGSSGDLTICDVRDVARAHIAAVETPTAAGRYIISDSHCISSKFVSETFKVGGFGFGFDDDDGDDDDDVFVYLLVFCVFCICINVFAFMWCKYDCLLCL